MNDKPCIIEINGTEYFYPCDKKDSLILVDGHLINTSSSAFTLYHEFPEYGDSYSGYPRVVCNSNTMAYLRSSASSGSYQTLQINSIEFKTSSFSNDVLLLIVLVGVGLCQLFKR